MIAKAPFLSLLASITSVQALGINCEGSSTCDVAKGSASQVQHVVCEIAGLNPDRYYSAGRKSELLLLSCEFIKR